MPKHLIERATGAAKLVTESAGSPRYRVRLIEGPRWGSSGFYTSEALDSAPSAFAGTKAYLDHPTASEDAQRPERSLRDLVGHYEHVSREADGVWGDLVVRPHMAELVESLASNGDLDVSIRATAEATPGEVNGRAGLVISRFLEGRSVDLVTEAGAGGRVYELIESARAAAPVEEATTSDRHDQLTRVLRDTYEDRDNDVYVRLRDFDDVARVAYYEHGRATWQQGYTVADDDLSVTLTGERTEVRPVTTYHPVTSAGPVGESAPAKTTKEKHMEITEAKFAELTAAADRVTALEAELAAEKQRAEAAEADARKVAREAYDQQVAAAISGSDLPQAARDRVADVLKLDESADVPADPEQAIEAAIKAEQEYVKQVAEAARTPRPLGFGGSSDKPVIESYVNAWGRTINTKEA